ncbi:site-specific integrase [Mesorhizobium sp. KR1-2]|uniref:site-specific integrase n=1 Tax=Mesorhizobium sp. KR1-2 TaxID=3156609 RepID=UPI0032B57B69
MDDMARFPGLRPRGRGGIFYFRVRVPKDLVERIGRKDIWVSLGTNDFSVAKERYLEQSLNMEREFAEQRRRRDVLVGGDRSGSTDREAEAVLAEVARALARKLVAEARTLNEFDKTRYEYDEEQAGHIASQIDGDLVDLRAFNENGQLRVSQAVRRLLNKQPVTGPSSPSDPALRQYVRRALIVIAEEERARFAGDFSRRIIDADFQDIGADDLSVRFTPEASLTVRAASEIFWRHKFEIRPLSAKTERKYRAALDQVVAYLGVDRYIGTVRRSDCMQFRDVVARLPSNFTKRAGKGRSLEEAAALADERGLPKMAFETQVTYLNMMLRFLKWAHNEEHIQDIRLGDIEPLATKGRPEGKRRSFTDHQLTAIFHAPIYTGCMDDEYRFARPGPHIVRRSRYWVPLIALFTGMRLGEILQLTTEHIRKSEAGTNFIVLTPDMRLKTPESEREIPIHSALVSFGFLNFVDEKRANGKIELFDDVPLASDGTRSTLFSKRFASFLRSVGIKDLSSRTCFHVFRHTMKDALDRGQVPEEQSDAICGWTRGKKTGRRYGTGKEADTLAPWIEMLSLPRVDLSHLRMTE